MLDLARLHVLQIRDAEVTMRCNLVVSRHHIDKQTSEMRFRRSPWVTGNSNNLLPISWLQHHTKSPAWQRHKRKQSWDQWHQRPHWKPHHRSISSFRICSNQYIRLNFRYSLSLLHGWITKVSLSTLSMQHKKETKSEGNQLMIHHQVVYTWIKKPCFKGGQANLKGLIKT